MQKLFYLAILLISCNTKEQQSTTKKESKSTSNDAISLMINDYIALKDAFIKEDSTVLTNALNKLKSSVLTNELSFITDSIKKERIIKAKDTIQQVLDLMTNATTIVDKRKQFKLLTNPLQTIATQYNTTTLYVQNCPMAGEYSIDKNVYWLSREEKIYNPFFPKQMLRCGSITDTLLATK